MRMLCLLERQTKSLLVGVGLAAAILIGFCDYLASWEYSFTVFYLLPAALVGYSGGRTAGLIVAAGSAASSYVTEHLLSPPYGMPFVYQWNCLSRLAIFAFFACLLAYLRARNDEIARLANCDHLTGLLNRRRFCEVAENEFNRSSRYEHPLTLVYIDLDFFKGVNDAHGHHVGDDLLRKVGETIQANLRATDVAARLGGDEFAVLLSESGRDSARDYLTRIQRLLLDAMETNGWNVTFSIGAVTYYGVPDSIDAMIEKADGLMYAVKRDGRNQIRQQVHGDAERVAALV